MKCKKLLAGLLSAAMVLSSMALPAFADDELGDAAVESAAPDMSGEIINVTAKQAQDVLDGVYGNINGKTINFTENIDYILDLARPTKYESSGTVYYNGSGASKVKVENVGSLGNGICTYERTLSKVTFTAEAGVKVAGFVFSAGHIHGTTDDSGEVTATVKDYVRDTKSESVNDSYYRCSSLQDITFKDLTITQNIYLALQQSGCVGKDITFTRCSFEGNDSYKGTAEIAAIKMLSDLYYFENTTIENCTMTNYFQGLWISAVNGITVTGNTVSDTGHNALAIQSSTGTPVTGDVVVEHNKIIGAKDRGIRFGNIDEKANIKVCNNIIVESGDTDGQNFKAGDVKDGCRIDLNYNYWDGRDIAIAVHTNGIGKFIPVIAGIGESTWNEDVSSYVADGYYAEDNDDGTWTVKKKSVVEVNGTQYKTLGEAIKAAESGDTIKLLCNITEPDAADENIVHDLTGKTLDLNGFTYSANNFSHIFAGTGGTVKNGKMVGLNNASYALWIGDIEPATTSFTVEDVECTGGINVFNATGVVLKDNLSTSATNYYAVWADGAAEVTIEGGEYRANKTAVLGAVKVTDKETGESYYSKIAVKGGRFICNENDVFYEGPGGGGKLIVTAGTFDKDVTEYFGKGYDVTKNADGTYSVINKAEKLDNTNLTTKEKTDIINVADISNIETANKVVEAIKTLPAETKEQIAPEKVAEIIEAKQASAEGETENVIAAGNAEVEAATEDTTSIDAALSVTALKSNEFDTLNVKAKTSGETKSIKLPTGTKAAYFDVTLTKTDVDVSGNETTKNVSEVSTPMLLKFTVDNASKVAGVIRYHDDKQEYIDYRIDGNTILVTAAKFSEYAVALVQDPVESGAVLTFSDPADNDGKCDIYLKGYDKASVTKFVSGEFSLKNEVTSGNVGIEIEAADGLTINYNETKGIYEIHQTEDAADKAEYPTVDDNNKIKLGTLTLTGTGAGMISAENIIMNRRSTDGNNENINIETTSAMLTYDVKAATAELTVKVAFPNNIENQKTAYQDMTVTISGGDLAEDIAYSLGSDASANVSYADNTYTLTVTDTLSENVAYTVTVSGAGYRTARYTVNMTGAKVLNFWNNVKDNAIEVVTGDGTPKNITFLAGDIVKDNQINIYDLSAVVSYFGQTGISVEAQSDYAKYDLNRDGKIDSKDIAYVLVSWGK